MSWALLQGDVLDRLAGIESGTVQTCITSPPYWRLRDYGCEGQLGLEPTPEEYTANMVEVFREVRRVLRDDGTLWINLGDSYAGGGRAGNNPDYYGKHKMFGKDGWNPGVFGKPQPVPVGLKSKDLVGIPWRVAFALQSDGWWLRTDIIWHKPNPMPESVTDRPTKAHEYIFLLSKSARYFYDHEAIKEPHKESSIRRNRYGQAEAACAQVKVSRKQEPGEKLSPAGRNKRSVWTVAPKPFPGAHFAVFPPKLVEPCVLAGTSPKACEICGAPWERIVERTSIDTGRGRGLEPSQRRANLQGAQQAGVYSKTKTIGWQPTCTCENKGTGRCVVLDPFVGSGTTLYVAESLGRDSIGIELNPEYCRLIKERMDNRQQTIFELEDEP